MARTIYTLFIAQFEHGFKIHSHYAVDAVKMFPKWIVANKWAGYTWDLANGFIRHVPYSLSTEFTKLTENTAIY